MIKPISNPIIAHPKSVIIFTLLLTLICAIGILNLKITTDMRVYFDNGSMDVVNLNQLEKQFGSTDMLYVAAIPKNGDTIFTPHFLNLFHQLTQDVAEAPYLSKVESLTNFQKTVDSGEELIIGSLYPRSNNNPLKLGDPESQADIADIKAYAMGNPLLQNFLVSKSGDAAAMKLSFNLSQDVVERLKQSSEPSKFIRSLLQSYESRYPNISFHVIGPLLLNLTIAEITINDIITCIPLSYMVICLLLYLLLRQAQSIPAVLFVITMANTVIMGLTGWLNIILSPLVAFVLGAVIVIGVADCVHLLTTYYNRLADGNSRREALEESIKKNLRPITITSLTTIIGFLCLSFSESPPYKQLGYLMSAGAFAAYFFSITFLPAFLALTKAPSNGKRPALQAPLQQLANSMIKHHKLYLAVSALVALSLSFPFTKNQLNDNWHHFFDDSVKLRADSDAVNQRLTGLHAMHYVIESEPGDLLEPENLAFMDAFREWYLQQSNVAYVSSLSEVMKGFNLSFNYGDPDYSRLPESRSLAADYLLAYEMSVPSSDILSGLLNTDRSATLFSVSINKSYSNDLIALNDRADQWIRDNYPEKLLISQQFSL